MSIFKIYTKEVTWPAWKFGMLKGSMMAFGVIVGAAFPEFWSNWTVWLWAIFIVTTVVSTYWGIQSLFGREASAT